VTRPHHALEGKVLEVFGRLRHKGKPHFVLVLPDGSRSYIPVDWTDWVPAPESSSGAQCLVAYAADLLRLRHRVDCLLRRIEPGLAVNQNSPSQEPKHATTTTGTVESGAAYDPADLSAAHPSTTQPDRQ
jgi:hypothetical protein